MKQKIEYFHRPESKLLYRVYNNNIEFDCGGFCNWKESSTFDSLSNGQSGIAANGTVVSPLLQLTEKQAKKLYPKSFK